MRFGFNETNFFNVIDKLVDTSNKYYVVSNIDTTWSKEVYNLAEHLIREAYIYYELDQYDKSIERCYLFDSIIKTYSNFAPHQLGAIKYNVQKDCILAKCFFAKHEEFEALSTLQIAFNKFVDFYWDVSVMPKGEKYKTVYSEKDRETALKRYDDLKDLIYKSTYLSDSYIYNQLCYNQCLLEKGILLETSSLINKIALETNNIHYFNILKHKKELEGYHNIFSIDSIENLIDQEERLLLYELADSINTLGKETLLYEMSDIADKLSSELAIEFFTVTIAEDSTMYCALLLRHDSQYPELIPLFEEKEVSSIISSSEGNITNQTYDFYSDGDSISQLVWSKILPKINEGETIYFAPSGLLHQLAIEYLPYDENRTMSDVYNMVRLSSTREIVLNKKNTEYTTATIYGGIAYDLEEDVLLAESEKYATENLLASRSIENNTLNRGNVKYLPGTKIEAEHINSLLQENNITAKLYTAAKANEESFKSLSGKHSNILHIGTHGFTWTDSVAKKQDYFSQRMRMQMLSEDKHHDTSIDPLNRCGLLFAGANIALQGNSKNLPEGVQDGILTAKEISLMDLRDANLVVLSACETAKGDITSEGVFGLQRAFKMAGVQTIIMSLWKVNDQATQLLMTEFYNNWIGKHQSKRDAFRNAQNTVRAKYEEPEYWAGFIMLD
jgi:CHAT domain-containing protein